jgi:hypothetical protein
MKKHHPILFLSYVTLAIATIGCSSSPQESSAQPQNKPVVKEMNKSDVVIKHMAVQNNAPFYREIRFKKGSSRLDEASRRSLSDLIAESREAGDIQEFKIVAWSDEAYPSNNAPALPKAQKDLADKRNAQIKSFVKSHDPEIKIAVYNMAKRPNALQKALDTQDAKTKRSFEQAGIAAPTLPEPSEIKSMAVVFSIMKMPTRSAK